MSETPDPKTQQHYDRVRFWNEVIFPMAKAVETFFWRLAWFALLAAVIVKCLLSH